MVLAPGLLPPPSRAADDKVLQHVKGEVGYRPASDAPVTTVFGKFLLPDDYLAITRAQSAALLTLPDSSIVALGENTDVQVGAFNQTLAGPGSTITVNGGTLRFDIRRPQGGTANYRFTTVTTQIAVRGTIGLLSFVGGNTTVACLVCAADSVAVTVGAQTFSLASGQVLTVSAAGVVATAPLTATTLSTFSSAQVSTDATSGSVAATSGVLARPSSLGTVGVAAQAAAIAGSVGAVVSRNATPSAGPSPAPTTSANVGITNKARPVAAPAPPAPTPPEPTLPRAEHRP
jgi:hypothetical protein